MKLVNTTIVAIVMAVGFSLTAYVVGQGQGTSVPTNAGQNVQAGQNLQGQTGRGAMQPNTAKPETTIGPLSGTKGSNAAQPETTIGPLNGTKGSNAAHPATTIQPLDDSHGSETKQARSAQDKSKQRPSAAPTGSP